MTACIMYKTATRYNFDIKLTNQLPIIWTNVKCHLKGYVRGETKSISSNLLLMTFLSSAKHRAALLKGAG